MTAAAATAGWRSRPVPLPVWCALAYLPFTLLGYGTDIDVANVLRAGRSWLDDGDYQLSRGPGAAIHELATAALDRVGGSVLVNLASVAFAVLVLWAAQALLEREERDGRAAVLVLATNPWFWIAATSLGDFVWALALALTGAVMAQRDRRVVAGVLFGLAIGSRASTALLVVAWLIAERAGRPAAGTGSVPSGGDSPPMLGRARWRATAVTATTAVVVGGLCFVPPWLDAGRTLSFLDNELEFEGARVHLGRWAVKNLAVIGVLGGAVWLVGARHLASGVRRWGASPVARFAVLTIVASELLYFRLPFKPLHLLPVVAGLALLIGSSPTVTRRWLVALVVAQLVGGLIGTTLASPDVEGAAQSGTIDLGITAGPLLADVRCRLDDRDLGPWPDPSSTAAMDRAAANFACQSRSWRAG